MEESHSHQHFNICFDFNYLHLVILSSLASKCKDFNPKARRLFDQLNMREGADSAHFGKHSLTPPNFILEQQTEFQIKAEVFS